MDADENRVRIISRLSFASLSGALNIILCEIAVLKLGLFSGSVWEETPAKCGCGADIEWGGGCSPYTVLQKKVEVRLRVLSPCIPQGSWRSERNRRGIKARLFIVATLVFFLSEVWITMPGISQTVCQDCSCAGTRPNHIWFISTYGGGLISIWHDPNGCTF